jgi:hypothetical protein
MIFQEKFRENMFFRESFLEMCKTGANTRGTLKTFAVVAKMLIIFANIFAKTKFFQYILPSKFRIFVKLQKDVFVLTSVS